MRITSVIFFASVILWLCGCSCGRKADFARISTESGEWELVWNDEFDSDSLDRAKWSFDTSGNSIRWGNNELQRYVEGEGPEAFIQDGILTIRLTPSADSLYPFTSARINTKGKASWRYGRFEARLRLPAGKGTWPAFWLMPEASSYGVWPRSGEIDIMENVGYARDSIVGTVHTYMYNHHRHTQKGASIMLPRSVEEFHIYAVEWDEEQIRFYADGQKYFTFENNGRGEAYWPFDREFYIILNFAAGGDWGGKKGVDFSAFPQDYQADYVRVYKKIS